MTDAGNDARSQIESLGPGPFFVPPSLAKLWQEKYGPLPENIKVHPTLPVNDAFTIERLSLIDLPDPMVDQPPTPRGAQWKRERNRYGRRR